MKIARIEPILIAVPFSYGGPPQTGPAAFTSMDTLFVRVETDTGIVGWGEAYGMRTCRVTRAAFESQVIPLALGRDCSDIAGLMADLQRRLHNSGRNGPVSFALSGLDIALWDIAGKAAGVPLCRLLGGHAAAPVPVYASLLRYGDAGLVERNAGQAVARGYRLVKVHEITEACVAAARAAIGPAIPLMVDCNCPWPADEAVAMAKRLAPQNLKWLEEPVWPPDDYAGLARVRRDGGVAVAAGENAGSRQDFLALGEAVDFIQPSLPKMGGITVLRQVIETAKARNGAVALHSPFFGPSLMASLHVIAALLPGGVVERFYCDLEASPLGAAIEAKDGVMHVPDGPGLGLSVDETTLARYRVE
jgi:D-galactarolactone cycloisomerase